MFVVQHDFKVYAQPLLGMSATKSWTLAGKCCAQGIAIHQNTVYIAASTTNDVWTQPLNTMTSTSDWTLASKHGIIQIAIHGDTIWAVGTNKLIYKQTLSTMTNTSAWIHYGPGSCLDIAIHKHNVHGSTMYCVGGDKNIYKMPLTSLGPNTPSSTWEKIGGCCITSIAIQADNIYGSGTDGKLYKATWKSTWTKHNPMLSAEWGTSPVAGPHVIAIAPYTRV